jgi:nucleoside-diphosphate-sugar epimerase
VSFPDDILVTGATGAIGPALLRELAERSPTRSIRVLLRRDGGTPLPQSDRGREPRSPAADPIPVIGDVRLPGLGLSRADLRTVQRSTGVVIHAAADTRLGAPEADLIRVNLDGTRHALETARGCRRLRRFVLVSTNCVAGRRTGLIPESVSATPPEFVNAYERSKWLAERAAVESGLPIVVVRAAIVIGSRVDGSIGRPGAFHHALRWLRRGLVPMLPALPNSTVDVIDVEFAAALIAAAADAPADEPRVVQATAGRDAAPIAELLDLALETFARRDAESGRPARPLVPPVLADADTFALFRDAVRDTGDARFDQVMEAGAAFLPGLLYPKVYAGEAAARLSAADGRGPLRPADRRDLLPRVIAACEAAGARGEVCRV